jgi:aryl-alcohol dehydrogenase-like predicted oxidoreductase
VLKNPNVSTVLTGASTVKQVEENLSAAEVVSRLTPEILSQIDGIFGLAPQEDD